MAKYDNSGALFKNDKQGNATWADYKGSITIDGEEYWLSAWIKEGKDGKFMSLAVKPKGPTQKLAAKAPARRTDSDDIPF